MTYFLDASAMIGFLRDEPDVEIVVEVLVDTEPRCYAHALNLCDVLHDSHRTSGRQEALSAISDLERLGILLDAELSTDVWQAAGTFKADLRRSVWSLPRARTVDRALQTGDTIISY